MKVCENCSDEIFTKDGENRCGECENAHKAKRARANAARKRREDLMRSLGLTKARGALGGTYWE